MKDLEVKQFQKIAGILKEDALDTLDINNGPVGNDKLEEFEDDDSEHMDGLHAILDQAAFQRFVKSVTIIAEDLLQDGFEPEDIEDFLVKEIRSIIG